MLALLIVLLAQDPEILTVDNITPDQAGAIGYTIEEFDKKQTGSPTRSTRRKLHSLVRREAMQLYKLTIPEDELDPIIDHCRKFRSDLDATLKISIYAEPDEFRGDVGHMLFFRPKERENQNAIISFFTDGKKVTEPATISYRIDMPTREAISSEPPFAHGEIDVTVDGRNVLHHQDTKIAPASELTDREGWSCWMLEAPLTTDQMRAVFGDPERPIAVRFGQHKIAVDKIAASKIHRWLSENYPEFNE